MKICKNCRITKSIKEFNKHKSSADGLRSNCRECTKMLDKLWYIANREHKKSYTKHYIENNRLAHDSRMNRNYKNNILARSLYYILYNLTKEEFNG